MKLIPLALLASLLLPVPTARAPHLAATVAGDSVRFVATWAPPTNPGGPITGYLVSWRKHDGQLADRVFSGTRLTDTATFALPNYPDSLQATVSVRSIRNGVQSATFVADTLGWFRRQNPVPPPPAAVTLDTLPGA